MVIDLAGDSSSDDGERPPSSSSVTAAVATRGPGDTPAAAAAAATTATAPYSQTIEVLAPVFPDVVKRCSSRDAALFPVTFHRTDADWIKLVFPYVSASSAKYSARASLQPLEKELVCANSSASGCRSCRFAQLLRGLLALVDKRVLRVDAKYVVNFPSKANVNADANAGAGSGITPSPSPLNSSSSTVTAAAPLDPVATIQLLVQLHEDASPSVSLQDFDFVIGHLQPAILAVAGYTRSSKPLVSLDALVASARESTCHVLGCTLHQRDGHLPGVRSDKLYLSDVFRSLTSPTDINQMEIREDRTYVARMQQSERRVIVTDLPIIALQHVVRMMNARDLASLSGVCSLFQHLAYEVVPGLNLVLYRHQRKALRFLLYREAPLSALSASLPHPFIFPPVRRPNAALSIDLVDRKIVKEPTPVAQDCRGGLFCDEPGLGKTITMLALLLRTKGQRASRTQLARSPSHLESLGRLRSSEARGRTVQPSDLVPSIASLIVVPSPLIEHWKFQIETHVEPGALRVFVDSGNALPSSAELATYDVVITSLERLAREWKYNRPASALEARAPERYGFEGPARYVDGEVRGEVSPLLRVHWVRVVVDEGHKLGGTAETSQMRMARIFFADKRWVMTGTPTPNTMHSADLRHMHGLLVFLKDMPFGHPDGKAWLKAIAKPFEQHEPIAFLRLQHLLSRIMMRHTKVSIRDIIPDPIRHTVFIDPTPKEHDVYNAVAGVARANLVATNYDPELPGRLHLDSLLNPLNQVYAIQAVKNLQNASCGSHTMRILLPQDALVEAINYARETGIQDEQLTTVVQYMNRAQEAGLCSPCMSCTCHFKLLMIIPCGHLCCADCVDDSIAAVGPRCPVCNAAFDIEVFQKLQPGFEFTYSGGGAMSDLTVVGAAPRAQSQARNEERREALRAWQAHQETSAEPRAPRPFLAINYLRDFDVVDASKALYVVARVKELKQEYARQYADASRVNRYASRHVKAIVFSQFTEHIWELKIAFAQQGIPTADFITHVKPKQRMKYLHAFRTNPSINVLLLTEVGSHGLDLSFVTHIFLLEQVWDKSLEKQVVSRAHRMGARQAVVVEQLVMRDTVEGVLLRMNEHVLARQEKRLKAAEASELSILEQYEEQGRSQHPPAAKSLDGVFPSKKKQKRRLKAKVMTPAVILQNESNESKATRLRQQLYYVLQNIRLLSDDVVAEPGHVRFVVEDDHGNVLRRGSHRMAAYKTSTGELVTMPPERRSASSSASTASSSHSGAATAASSPVASSQPTTATAAATATSGQANAGAVKSEARTSADASPRPPAGASLQRVVASSVIPPATPPVKSEPREEVHGDVSVAIGAPDRQRHRTKRARKDCPPTESAAAVDARHPSADAKVASARVKAEHMESSSGQVVLTSSRAAAAAGLGTRSPLRVKTEAAATHALVRVHAASPAAAPRRSPDQVKRVKFESPSPSPRTAQQSSSATARVKAEELPHSGAIGASSPHLGTATDPISLTDEDSDMAGTDAQHAARPTAPVSAQAPSVGQKRRVRFTIVDDDDSSSSSASETESDFIPSDSAMSYDED